MTHTQEADPTSVADPLDQSQRLDAVSCMGPAVMEWIARKTQAHLVPPLPFPSVHVFQRSTWGPRFSWAVWTWAQSLQWSSPGCLPQEGVTTLELLCDFVTQTGLLPPVLVPDANGGRQRLEFETNEAQAYPVSLRGWLHVLTCTLRQLERKAGVTLLAGASSRRVTSLQLVGDSQPRSGFLAHCSFHKPDLTMQLLRLVLVHRTVAPLWRHVLSASTSPWVLPAALQGK